MCLNEEQRIDKCLSYLRQLDRIYVMDNGSIDSTVAKIKTNQEYNELHKHAEIVLIHNKSWDGHFADARNKLVSVIDEDWVLFLDTDEHLEEGFIEEIRTVAVKDNEYDAALIPRRNFIDFTETDVYPDYQARFFRSFCRFIYPVHEELVGSRRKYKMNSHILHYKSSQKQAEQNSLYDSIIYRHASQRRGDHENW